MRLYYISLTNSKLKFVFIKKWDIYPNKLILYMEFLKAKISRYNNNYEYEQWA